MSCKCKGCQKAYKEGYEQGRKDALDWRKLGLPPAVISNADAWDGEEA